MTGPVRNAFWAMAHTDMTTQLQNIAQFKHVAEYPSQTNLLESEWGTILNTRWLISSIGSYAVNASSTDQTVYNNFICGMESYSMVEQDGYTATFIYRPPIFSDPLAQNITVGYKFGAAYRILNDEWIVNLAASLA